ncbi:MAG: tungstate ABC transporter substrate-binding protein WtpA [Thermofilum sp. ex4484_15]|nr:MAG: tungstate ABC transporter substrate-binding protein WtpA [Thermofilum sp. ex4484_15]
MSKKCGKPFKFRIWVIALIITLITLRGSLSTPRSGELIVFCAGSLYVPLREVASLYSESHPGVNVIIEPSGSVEAVRKVTELKRRCDVLALADYRLILKYMIPKYASWAIAFATNRLVICYTDRSKYSRDVNSSNWFEILRREGVTYGFSNPNDDPCGYRVLTALALANFLYGREVLQELVVDKTNISVERRGGKLHIYVPPDLEIKTGKIRVRSKSVTLIALLEAGTLDYAFEYESVAIQHKLPHLELPPELNLGYPSLSRFYSKVVVHIMAGTAQERALTGAPIVYGITVPKTAVNLAGAMDFIKFLLSDRGRDVFKRCGQPFLSRFLYYGGVPGVLKR